MTRRGKTAALVVLLAAAAGATFLSCAQIPTPGMRRGYLRVGVPFSAPPYASANGKQIVGFEVDFATELAAALGRPLDLRAMPFGELLFALIDGRVDLVMAGLTVTPARESQIAFSEPYLRSGLLAVVRREDAARYPTPTSVVSRGHPIGVVHGTTGERFVNDRVPTGDIRAYPTALAALDELRTRRIDVVVHDAPVVIWYASRDEAGLAPILKLLDDEPLAWGMRPENEALRAQVSDVLARWRSDGTRDRILERWLPYWKRLEAAERAR